jgi:hypothetical protein
MLSLVSGDVSLSLVSGDVCDRTIHPKPVM